MSPIELFWTAKKPKSYLSDFLPLRHLTKVLLISRIIACFVQPPKCGHSFFMPLFFLIGQLFFFIKASLGLGLVTYYVTQIGQVLDQIPCLISICPFHRDPPLHD